MFNIYFSFLKIIKHICYKILPEKRKCKYASMQIPFCICLILQFFLSNEQWIQYATSTSIFRCYWLRVQYLLYAYMSYQSTAARSQVTCRIECNLIELCFSVSILSFLDRCILILCLNITQVCHHTNFVQFNFCFHSLKFNKQ